MKNISLTPRQQELVNENLDVVRYAIHKYIIVNETICGLEYDDLYQEGCIWLCKAAATYDETRHIKFTTYAEKVVVNGLCTYCRLVCSKQKRMGVSPVQADDEEGFSFELLPSEDSLEKVIEEQDIFLLLRTLKQQYNGTARLGIEAIEWKVKGLSGTDIAKMYGVKPNLVGAWISRAAAKLKVNSTVLQYFGRAVENSGS